MTFNFKDHDPSGRKAWYTLPTIPSIGRLQMIHAGRSNKPYTNGLANITAKKGGGRTKVDSDTMDEVLQWDRDLFPSFVVVGWDGVKDSKTGKPVKFSKEKCKEYMNALPAWLMRNVSAFAAQPTNFLPGNTATDEEVKEQAKE